jgi:hypothetical protein
VVTKRRPDFHENGYCLLASLREYAWPGRSRNSRTPNWCLLFASSGLLYVFARFWTIWRHFGGIPPPNLGRNWLLRAREQSCRLAWGAAHALSGSRASETAVRDMVAAPDGLSRNLGPELTKCWELCSKLLFEALT